MIHKIHLSTDKYTIQKLYNDYYKNDLIIFNTEYQRSQVWNKNKKQKLIDSILRTYPIGSIFFKEVKIIEENKISVKYEVLDGQQRLRTLFEFMNDKFPTDDKLNPEIDSINYSEIKNNNDIFPDFISYQIIITLLGDCNDETTSDIFLRLQEGMPLNTAEKLNAMKGKIRNKIVEISKHRILKKTSISEFRFQHRLLVAQLLKISLYGNIEEMRFPDIKFKDLKEMYRLYSKRLPSRNIIQNIKTVFNKIDKYINDPSIIKNKGDFLPIFLLFDYLNKFFILTGLTDDELNLAIQEFLSDVENVNLNDPTTNPDEVFYKQYKESRSSGSSSSRSNEDRFKIILGKILENIKELPKKDIDRLFNYGQKLAIYYKYKGKCAKCKKDVVFSNAEFHHKISYSDGGQTIVENGELLHHECHIEIHNN